MNKVYLLLGSNLSDPHLQLALARKHISTIGSIYRQSALYQTAAWGNAHQPDFLNQVLILDTDLSAEKILGKILKIEKEMGRIRTEKNAPRIIDIDILFFNTDVIHTKDLIVPHPALEKRRFVLVPLNELSPDFEHPVLHKTLHDLLLECSDDLDVKRF